MVPRLLSLGTILISGIGHISGASFVQGSLPAYAGRIVFRVIRQNNTYRTARSQVCRMA